MIKETIGSRIVPITIKATKILPHNVFEGAFLIAYSSLPPLVSLTINRS